MHTKEPWRVEIDESDSAEWSQKWPRIVSDEQEIIGTEGLYSEIETDKANARRIVACVNACAGSPTEGLEEMAAAGRSLANMAMLYERAMDRRDELLAALKAIADTLNVESHGDPSVLREYAKLAISKAEGLTP